MNQRPRDLVRAIPVEAKAPALECAAKWGIELGEFIPFPGPATSSEWEGSAGGTTRVPGRNRPPVGAWLVDKYCHGKKVLCADPMIGAGGLWMRVPPEKIKTLYGADIEQNCVDIARKNLTGHPAQIEVGDAVAWVPETEVDLVLTSHPFAQSHSSGATEHSRGIREKKGFHNADGFGPNPANIANFRREEDRWTAIYLSYRRIRESLRRDGVAVVILRNYIRNRQEQPEVEKHIGTMCMAGLRPVVGYPRDLVRPVSYNQWKVAADPTFPWVRLEWAICCRK